MGERAYLDHNASTPLRPAAAEAMVRALALFGNPSSVHAEGRAARAAMDRARHQVANAVGSEAKNVIFTSGATEGLNTLLRGNSASDQIIVSAGEHSAVLGAAGEDGLRVGLSPDGRVDLSTIPQRQPPTGSRTIAIQYANGETGVVQPIAEAAALARDVGAVFVCDTVAAFGKVPIDIKTLGADGIVLSAHKFGGPKGIGAIILNGDRLRIREPLLKGGGQEMRCRSGTENIAGIVAMGIAAELAAAAVGCEGPRLAGLRDRLEAGLLLLRPDAVVFGRQAPRLPNTLNIGVPGLTSETAVIALDLAGVSVSAGSACSSGKVKRSHVLDAMGVSPELAEGALRFSLGWTTTEADIDKAVKAFGQLAGARGQAAA